ncbi:hypothetical protein FALBO_9763 [Fusarium albosuccineum]|uniref:Uncharacterized protein n=1 Tax=Fusarium albosuccineum TaxID=1237068 RepID=A0A8H4L889_9HYPO|nr:hypothetical protein FALBO_9763 [Fusarium albosuccineum]
MASPRSRHASSMDNAASSAVFQQPSNPPEDPSNDPNVSLIQRISVKYRGPILSAGDPCTRQFILGLVPKATSDIVSSCLAQISEGNKALIVAFGWAAGVTRPTGPRQLFAMDEGVKAMKLPELRSSVYAELAKEWGCEYRLVKQDIDAAFVALNSVCKKEAEEAGIELKGLGGVLADGMDAFGRLVV